MFQKTKYMCIAHCAMISSMILPLGPWSYPVPYRSCPEAPGKHAKRSIRKRRKKEKKRGGKTLLSPQFMDINLFIFKHTFFMYTIL